MAARQRRRCGATGTAALSWARRSASAQTHDERTRAARSMLGLRSTLDRGAALGALRLDVLEPAVQGGRHEAAERARTHGGRRGRLLRDVEALRHEQVQVVAWRASSRRTAAAALPRSRRRCRSPCPTGCSRRPRSARAPRSTPGPWPSGWSTGSGSPRRAAAGRPRRSSPPAGRASSSVRKRSRVGVAAGEPRELREVGGAHRARRRAGARACGRYQRSTALQLGRPRRACAPRSAA